MQVRQRINTVYINDLTRKALFTMAGQYLHVYECICVSFESHAVRYVEIVLVRIKHETCLLSDFILYFKMYNKGN